MCKSKAIPYLLILWLLAATFTMRAQSPCIPSFHWLTGSDPPAVTCSASINQGNFYASSGGKFYFCSNVSGGYKWDLIGTAVSPIPSHVIVFIKVGTCPTGWTEDDSLAGYNVVVTSTANGDVGTSGASTLAAAAQIFTGSSVTSGATSAGTPAGTNTLGGFAEGAIAWPVNPPTYSGTLGTLAAPAHTHSITQSAFTTTKFTVNSSGTAAYSGGGVVTTPSGSASSTTITGAPGGTISWPVNVPTIGAGTFTQPTFTGSLMATHTHTVTAAGTNASSTVTGTPAFFKMIACSKD